MFLGQIMQYIKLLLKSIHAFLQLFYTAVLFVFVCLFVFYFADSEIFETGFWVTEQKQ